MLHILTLFFMGEGKFYPAKIFLLILKNYGFGLPRFFREPNLVLKVFWKFQVNSMPISTLMTILWGDVMQCFLKQKLSFWAYKTTIYLSFEVYFIYFRVPCKK